MSSGLPSNGRVALGVRRSAGVQPVSRLMWRAFVGLDPLVQQRLQLLHGACPVVGEDPPLQEAEEALDLSLGLGVAGEVAE